MKKSKNAEWPEKMEKMIEQCAQVGPREIARNVEKSPFTDNILAVEKPRRFVTPIFQKYDGTTDLVDHIKGYK